MRLEIELARPQDPPPNGVQSSGLVPRPRRGLRALARQASLPANSPIRLPCPHAADHLNHRRVGTMLRSSQSGELPPRTAAGYTAADFPPAMPPRWTGASCFDAAYCPPRTPACYCARHFPTSHYPHGFPGASPCGRRRCALIATPGLRRDEEGPSSLRCRPTGLTVGWMEGATTTYPPSPFKSIPGARAFGTAPPA